MAAILMLFLGCSAKAAPAALSILGCRRSALLGQQVFQAPLLHVDGEHLVVDQAAAERAQWLRRRVKLRPQAPQQVVPDLARNIVLLGGIDIVEQD